MRPEREDEEVIDFQRLCVSTPYARYCEHVAHSYIACYIHPLLQSKRLGKETKLKTVICKTVI